MPPPPPPPLYLSPRRWLDLSADRVRDVLDEWVWVTSEFTRRSLSVSGDKLPALAGIAERFSFLLRMPYVGGLWEANLLPLLQWTTHSNRRKPRPCDYQAPSWSWASIDGTVSYNTSTDSVPFRCMVIECKLKLLSEVNPFGAVTSGYLKAKGPIRRAWFNPPEDITWNEPDAETDEGRISDASNDKDISYRRRDHDLYASPDTADDAARPPGWVFCFATVLRFYRSQKLREHGQDVWVDGMVLVPVDESGLRFQRIAHFGGGKKSDFARASRQIITIE
ncbi:hypothetical protein B0O99DRAFT_591679 [Bisporella sp. PMI_857]|nr:hypothetical protein B0O99DRAFT_591679 [Bisporella sp. PMI_857]